MQFVQVSFTTIRAIRICYVSSVVIKVYFEKSKISLQATVGLECNLMECFFSRRKEFQSEIIIGVMMTSEISFDDYETLLKRARDQCPEKVFEDVRFEIPRYELGREGNRTIIANFVQVAEILNRDTRHMLKFFASELGTAGSIDGNRAIFQGRHRAAYIQQLLERYVKQYVLCPVCGKPDTRLVTEHRITMMRCEACGAMSAVKSIT